MNTWLGFISETASYMGIKICSKCGKRTTMKYAGSVLSKTVDNWIEYTICPNCGNKEKWLSRYPP